MNKNQKKEVKKVWKRDKKKEKGFELQKKE